MRYLGVIAVDKDRPVGDACACRQGGGAEPIQDVALISAVQSVGVAQLGELAKPVTGRRAYLKEAEILAVGEACKKYLEFALLAIMENSSNSSVFFPRVSYVHRYVHLCAACNIVRAILAFIELHTADISPLVEEEDIMATSKLASPSSLQ